MAQEFFWYDLRTNDAGAARKFYGGVLGWSAENAGVSGEDYAVFKLGDRAVAGLMPLPAQAAKAGARPAWNGYIRVDDVDAVAARIRDNGGAVHREPMDVPGVIRLAVVADPQGAAFLIAKPLSPDNPPPPAMGTPGTIGWRELYAAEWKTAFAFYEKLFGWTKAEAVDMGPMGTYQLFAAGGAAIGGMMTGPAGEAAHWKYYINVEAIDAGAARVTAGGGRIAMGPHEVPGGQWIVQCQDPQGAGFALVAPAR